MKLKTIKAVHEHNRLRPSVGKCIKKVTACHIVYDVLILLMSQVPVLIMDRHMCSPGQPFFSFFQLYSSTIHAECKTQETPMPGRLEGGQAPTRKGVQGFVSARHFHCCEVTRERSNWSAK